MTKSCSPTRQAKQLCRVGERLGSGDGEEEAMKTRQTKSSRCLHPICSPLRRLVPGCGWRKPYAQSPHVWEDERGNRVIVHSSINGITYRTAAGKTGFHYDHEEPMRSALRRNASRKRAGLAAARVLMANAEVRHAGPDAQTSTDGQSGVA